MSGKAGIKDCTLNGLDASSYTDFLCPICLQILIKPVLLPCQHELCNDCFKKHINDTSLNCPMCRKRISVWVRKNTKSNTLVNTQRWNLIKTKFPERVKRRLDGLDDIANNIDVPLRVITPHGEVRKEYEEEIKKLKNERESMSRQAEQFIEQLVLREAEEARNQEELDRITAEKLQEEELSHLGVTLKSPTTLQKELLNLMKPKSPMRLRNRRNNPSVKTKTIKNYFKNSNETNNL